MFSARWAASRRALSGVRGPRAVSIAEIHSRGVSPMWRDTPPLPAGLSRAKIAGMRAETSALDMPLRSSALPVGPSIQLYRRAAFGDLISLQVLDTRQYRSDQPCDGKWGACDELDREAEMLGLKQEKWLYEGLSASKARWNVLAQQTRLTPGNYHAGLGQRFGSDTWDGYPQARQRLVDTLVQSKARNPLVLGGDIHQNWVAHVHQDPYNANSPVVATEFCGTSITSRSNATPESTARAMRNNPHCVYANAQHRGYGLLDLTPQRAQVTLRAVRDVANPDSEVFDLQRFEVKAGQPQVGVPAV